MSQDTLAHFIAHFIAHFVAHFIAHFIAPLCRSPHPHSVTRPEQFKFAPFVPLREIRVKTPISHFRFPLSAFQESIPNSCRFVQFVSKLPSFLNFYFVFG